MLEHLKVINPQVCADQYGENHCATLPPHLQGKVGRTQAVLITPAALSKRLADAWQAGFARAAEAAKTDLEPQPFTGIDDAGETHDTVLS